MAVKTWHRCRPRDREGILLDRLLSLHARHAELGAEIRQVQMAVEMVASGEYEFIPE